MTAHLKRLQILGLKGGPVDLELSKRTAIAGPNGAGKTRIGEAIAFLMGRPVAGLEIKSNTLRELLHGSEMRVVGTYELDTGATVMVTRVRSLSGSTFKRPVLLVDGQRADEGALFQILGGAGDLPGGRDLIDMSEAKLVAAVAGLAATGEAVDALEDQLAQTQVLIPDNDGTPTGRIVAMAKAAGDAHRAARRERIAVERGADLSRQALDDRFDPGRAPRLAKQHAAAQAEAEQAAGVLGQAQARLESHDDSTSRLRQEMAGLDRQLASAGDAPAAPSAEALAQADSKVTSLGAQIDEARAAERSLQEARREAADQKTSAIRDRDAARNSMQQIERDLGRAKNQAALIDRAPCSGCELWQPEDPFEEEVDLAGTCELLAGARRARNEVATIESGLEGRRAEMGGLEHVVAETTAALSDAIAAAATKTDELADLRRAQTQARQALSDLQRARDAAAHAGTADSLRARRGEVDLELAGLDAMRDDLVADKGRAEAEVEAARAKRDELATELSAARVQAERHRRLQADRQKLAEAEAVEQAAKAQVESIEEVQRGFIDEGVGMLRAAGSGYLPGLTIEISGGRLGVRGPAGTFWSGAGLSAAQRTMLEAALDRAFEIIAGRTYPILILEADPIDDTNLDQMLGTVDEAIASGELAQALVISWRTIKRDGWAEVTFAPEPTVEDDDPWGEEDDPWAESEEPDRTPIPELLEQLDGPALRRIWDDPEMPEVSCWPDKMPQRLAARRTVLAEVFSAFPYEVGVAAIEKARKK